MTMLSWVLAIPGAAVLSQIRDHFDSRNLSSSHASWHFTVLLPFFSSLTFYSMPAVWMKRNLQLPQIKRKVLMCSLSFENQNPTDLGP